MAKILIVDDSRPNRDLLKTLLLEAKDDYVVTEADSGESAFAMLQADLPDIILLDVMMPKMDGFELSAKLKAIERYKMIPILFITAMEKTEDKVKGFAMGAADYITKPFNPDEVKVRVNAHLKIKEAEENRIKVENLKTIKDMIATYNHNMNQPLMAAYTYMEVLLQKSDKQDKTYKTLTKIKNELDRINEILKTIQSISEIKRVDYLDGSKMLDLET